MKHVTLAKKLVLSLALLTTATSLSACTDEEVNTAVGVAAVGAAVAIVVAGGGNQRPDDRRDFDRRDRGFDRGRDRRGAVAPAAAAAKPSIDAAAFAKTFKLSTTSSSLFLGALERAKAGDGKAVQSLGITQQDIEGLKTFQLPSESSIREVAKNIKADSGVTRDMLSALLSKAAEQTKAVQAAN